MTLLGYWGFDDAVAEQGAAPGATTGRTGGKAASTASGGLLLTLDSIIPAGQTFIHGIAIQTAVGNGYFLQYVGSDASTHFRIGMDAAGHIRIEPLAVNGPVSTRFITANTWFYLEVKATIAEAGSIEVRVNNEVWVSYTGDTRAGTVGDLALINRNAPVTSILMDDCYILDTLGSEDNNYLGDTVVKTLVVNGNGSSSQWVGSDSNSTDNYLLVDEVDSSMTDYVGASTSGFRDLYTLTDLPTSDTVVAISELVYALKNDGGVSANVIPVAKGQSGTIRTDAALPALSTSAVSYRAQIRKTDPDGNALTAARVNAMEIGVQVQ